MAHTWSITSFLDVLQMTLRLGLKTDTPEWQLEILPRLFPKPESSYESAPPGRIFISYRRQDSNHLAGRLYDRLADRFGTGQVFIDVDAIEPGVDFAKEINRAVAASTVLLAVIGPNWLTAADERGRRRLDNPGDFVRLEIEAALARDVRVIPILGEGAVCWAEKICLRASPISPTATRWAFGTRASAPTLGAWSRQSSAC
jgi:hypothetical protein